MVEIDTSFKKEAPGILLPSRAADSVWTSLLGIYCYLCLSTFMKKSMRVFLSVWLPVDSYYFSPFSPSPPGNFRAFSNISERSGSSEGSYSALESIDCSPTIGEAVK